MALSGSRTDWRNGSYLALATFLLLICAGNIHAASFDCGKAASQVEKIICSDAELSKLDDSLSEAYQEALKTEAPKTPPKAKIIESQRQWLKKVRNRCQNAACLTKAYETRIRELSWFRGGGTITATEPVSGTYARTDLIRDMSVQKETWEYAESTVNLSMKDKNTFTFDSYIVGADFHTCQLSGLAVRRGRFFEYRGTEPADDCVLKFSFQGDFVRLEDEALKCRIHCGRRAWFDRVVLYRSGAIRKANPATVTIFYLDENYHPVVKLERLGPMSDGMRAILAMYAMQNGAGCAGGIETITCLLTDSLNLGGQCSKEHINLIRTWFNKSIPDMGGYGDLFYKNIQRPGHLESICYKTPEGATYQKTWDIIRVTRNGNHVTVDARGTWLAHEETGSFRYITEYKINKNSVTVISHREVPVGKKK